MNLTKEMRWTPELYAAYINALHELKEEGFQSFQAGLIPGCSRPILGVRTPHLRKLAKEISKTDWRSFLSLCRDDVYEEVILRAFLLGLVRPNYEELCQLIDSQVELTDNWSLCDGFCGSLKIVRQYRAALFPWFSDWLTSENPWRVRVALVMFLEHYLTDDYIDRVIALCDSVTLDHYYVKMAQAWLLSMCCVHHRDKTLTYLQTPTRLDNWTYNKTLQKCRESFRVTAEDKAMLKGMRRG